MGVAAESLGLSKAQTVEMVLGQYLTHKGMLTTNTAVWPKPKPPASVQRPITLPTPLVRVGCSPSPGNISDATPLGYRQWDSHRTAGRQGLPSVETMDATSKPGQRTNPGEDGGRHQSPPSTKRDLSWSEVALTYILGAYVEVYKRLLKAPRSPRRQTYPLGRPKLGDSAALYETQPF